MTASKDERALEETSASGWAGVTRALRDGRRAVDASSSSTLARGSYAHAMNFSEFERAMKSAKDRAMTLAMRLRLNAARECREDEEWMEDEIAAWEEARDAAEARTDAAEAEVMRARGDDDGRLEGVRSERDRGAIGLRRLDVLGRSSVARPQDAFEDAVENARANGDERGKGKMMTPMGYATYDAYARALKSRTAYGEFMTTTRAAVLPTPMDDEHPLEVVDTEDSLEALAAHLEDCDEFAVDLEHHSYRSFKGFTCLMQISTRERDFVVDALKLRSAMRRALGDAFANENKLKVMHGADNDVQWLQKDFGIFLSCLFDTGQAARVLELPSKGLNHLLHHYCGVKSEGKRRLQLADWRTRPLTKEMMDYARGDTHHLLYIYDRLKEALHSQGATRIAETFARSRDVCLKVYEPPAFDEGSYYVDLVKNDNLRDLSEPQLAVYAALFSWRDLTARDADESLGYVMPRGVMLRLATVAPKSERALLAECRGEAPLVAQHAAAVSELISRAYASGKPSFKPIADDARDSSIAAPVVVELAAVASGAAEEARTVAPAQIGGRKRSSMAVLMSGAAKTAKPSPPMTVPLSAIFGQAWSAVQSAQAGEADDAATATTEDAPARPAIEAKSEGEMIELPGGVKVPAPFKRVHKDRPFMFPTDASVVEGEAAEARALLRERRREVMRGYDDSDSDETEDDEIRAQMIEEAKLFDNSEARDRFTSQAKEKFGMSGMDLLFKSSRSDDRKDRRGFNERFKAVYEEPFKPAPKPKMFPREGNKYTTFKN